MFTVFFFYSKFNRHALSIVIFEMFKKQHGLTIHRADVERCTHVHILESKLHGIEKKIYFVTAFCLFTYHDHACALFYVFI